MPIQFRKCTIITDSLLLEFGKINVSISKINIMLFCSNKGSISNLIIIYLVAFAWYARYVVHSFRHYCQRPFNYEERLKEFKLSMSAVVEILSMCSISGYSLEMVDSFEDMIKSFHQRVEERSRFLANQHTENLLDLINIKKSLKGGPRGSRQSNSLSPN